MLFLHATFFIVIVHRCSFLIMTDVNLYFILFSCLYEILYISVLVLRYSKLPATVVAL